MDSNFPRRPRRLKVIKKSSAIAKESDSVTGRQHTPRMVVSAGYEKPISIFAHGFDSGSKASTNSW